MVIVGVKWKNVDSGRKTAKRGKLRRSEIEGNDFAQGASAMVRLTPPLSPDNERGVVVNVASVAAYEGQIGGDFSSD